MRVATIDIGTNSVLLLVAQSVLGDSMRLDPLAQHATITRLGQGVDRTRRLDPDAVARTLACLQRYAGIVRDLGAERVAVVTTSAARDAAGTDGFLDAAERALGVRPRVISGDDEARLTFLGSVLDLDLAGDIAVQDIGGGSTELVCGSRQPEATRIRSAVSLDIGSVRLTERHLRTDPPRSHEIEALRSEVRVALGGVARPPAGCRWVGIAGTVTTLAAISIGLVEYRGERVHGLSLTIHQVSEIVDRLAELDLSARRKVPGLEPARADVIVAGGVIAYEVLSWAGAEGMVVSDRGVRWGLAMELAV